jgi:GTP cyclohydrolase I
MRHAAHTEGYDELVLVEDLPVRSLCEHQMLFRGRTVTSALLGALRDNPSARAEHLSLTRRHKEA